MERYKLLKKLIDGEIFVSDGAWGTMLHEKGLRPGECAESWNLKKPDDVFDIASSYISAGSQIILTNSFGGSSFKLDKYGLKDKVYEINKASAEISRKAAGEDHLVFGSVGPTGIILMMGEVTPDQLYDSFKTQTIALHDGGVDVILFETFSDTDEAEIAIRAARESVDIPVACTFSFEKTIDGDYKTMMGYNPEYVIPKLIEWGVSIIGSNCGNGSKGMIEIIRKIRRVDHDKPVIIHSNAGMPVFKDGETIFPETPEEMSGYIPEMIKEGATIIGGCCGTTPKHIEYMARQIKLYK
ncbi:MAG TPA: methionine synthase [Bacteroidales bacterium]|nr:methionine synthase [Bacteroidales bacterium]